MVLPWIKYKYHQRKYFKLLKKKGAEQKAMNAMGLNKSIDQDEVLELAKKSDIIYNEYWDRVVLYLSGKECKSIKNCDMDQVELNYHRDSFVDTVDHFAEVF